MKRDDIIDSLEYIDDTFIEEADRARSAAETPAGTEKVISLRKKQVLVRRWGTLAASFAVLLIAAAVFGGILKTRSGNMAAMQSTEATAVENEAAEPSAAENNNELAEPSAAENEAAEPSAAENEFAEPSAAERANDAAAEGAAPADAADTYAAEEAVTEKAEETEEKKAAAAEGSMKIRVVSESGEVVFALNNTPAAKALFSQLPLETETETEPYSSNEIVFHPEEPLDTENGMEGGGTAGYLGYVAPWDNVVMYYGDFDEYPGLFILGRAVSGEENIRNISGRIVVEPLE